EGACCPAFDGTYLGCCETFVQPEPSGSGNSSSRSVNGGSSQKCSDHPGCAGLVGNCCPTELGLFLDCCGGG
ncbi:unnamed protein product, partial [Discosporangium mesarthrocarpum]